MNVRFSLLLCSPLLDTDITSPAAGVPLSISWKRPGVTGDSGKLQSARTKSVITPGNLCPVLLGAQPLLTT